MNVIGIIQARMGSKRLPDKSMLPLAGKPLIYRFIERVKRAELLNEIVLATTEKPEDDCLIDVAKELGIKTYRGAENDLVDRIYKCALHYNADIIVRLCADNPLIESEEIDRIIKHYLFSSVYGYMFSNTHNIQDNGYPDGLGAEVYDFKLFKKMFETVKDPIIREHPHKNFDNGEDFGYGLVKTIPCPEHLQGYSNLKLDVNTQQGYEYIKGIYDKFGHNDFHFTDYAKEA